VAGRTALDVEAEDFVRAANQIFEEQGLDAVSMRTVSARLGVSPVPIYSRLGNKESLLDAMADQLLVDAVAPIDAGEFWNDYAVRWATALRDRISSTPDVRLLLGNRRSPYVAASRPLVDASRAAGFTADAAVQTCRLLLWATIGFVVVEVRRPDALPPVKGRRPGGSPVGVTPAEADQLFHLHVGYLLRGVEQDVPHDCAGAA
jgi:TetR/AcrR family transcriptional regulator, tetracycline repressor protein